MKTLILASALAISLLGNAYQAYRYQNMPCCKRTTVKASNSYDVITTSNPEPTSVTCPVTGKRTIRGSKFIPKHGSSFPPCPCGCGYSSVNCQGCPGLS